ncbi:hypothetical protein B9Z55_028194 [Caenorhabditis nigoni]|nr:hypothetical protein B9Z55_028194 [Caenorhabditis nigoni]
MNANFPTDEELDFMHKHCEIIDATKFYRTMPGTLKLPPTRIQLRNLDKLPKASLDVNVGRIFDIFIRHMLQQEGGNLETTRYWLNLAHPGYRKNDGFWISHKTYKMADGHTLMNTIADQVQSNDALGLDETMSLTMRIFKEDIHGKGGRTPDNILKKFGVKQNYVKGDGHCLLKALVIGKHWSDKNTASTANEAALYSTKYLKLTRSDHTERGRAILQEEQALELMEDAGMDVNVMDHTLEDLRTLADYLSNYRITVWTMEPGVASPTIIFDENQQADGFISLYHHDEHFDYFHPSVETVRVRFCFKCGTLGKKDHYKKCVALCKRCGFPECERGTEQIYCSECNIHFSSRKCFDQHLVKKSLRADPHCKAWVKCKKCHKIYKTSGTTHICFTNRFCKICMTKYGDGPHVCSHAKPTDAAKKRALKKQENWTFLIYDFECQVTKAVDCKNGVYGMKQLPNLLCYRMICNKCMGGNCDTCERGNFSYMNGGRVVEQFTKFLITTPKLQNAYILAHNGGRYDHVLSMEQMLKEELYDQKFLLSGTTILSATVKVDKKNTLTFRDSVKYLQMSLDQLPKAFNLETKSKGTFPYMFNHPDRHGTVLPHHPPAEYYEPNRMSIKKREEFLKWYDEVKDREFDFDKEFLAYCQTNVDILTEAIVKFIETCNQTNASKWNPIIQCPTLPSFLMFIMTHEHIGDGDIGYIPENGWPGRNNSVFALKYILWLEREKPWLKLQHKLRRGGEYRENSSFFVDGYNEETNEVFEIHGCLWHGCPKCFPNSDAQCPLDRETTMGELYDKTIRREEELRSAGYLVHAIWECEIKEMLRRDPEMNEFFKKCRNTHALRPREAMYGGRTQQFQSIYIANDEYDIEYYDFCSEYPKVNMKGGEYPRGTPQVLTSDFAPIVDGQPLPYKGLIYCDALPPRDCALPVLPHRGNGKLLFPLCSTCASTKNPPPKCPHTNVSDRYLTGVWCHDELNLAISEGYTILRYHEVWNWPAEAWFRGGFFESFMKPLLKMKHAASGWPRPDMSTQEKQAHVDSILENDGVELSVDSVVANPALLSLKVGHDPKCFEEWGDTHILVSRQPIKDIVTTSRFSNIVYGALTTSAARVDLFNAMKLVGAENLIYCDTDSIIFRQKKGTDPLAPLKGEALGQMTNEVPAGWKISEIVALAPKVYAYKMINTDTAEVKYISKAKGVTLNYETSEKVNFETMKQLIQEQLSGNSNHITVNRMRMKRGANFLDGLESIDETKRIRCVMGKGTFDAHGQLTPFGHMPDEDLNQDYPFY